VAEIPRPEVVAEQPPAGRSVGAAVVRPAAAREAHQRADRPAAVRQRQVAVVAMSAGHAPAQPLAEAAMLVATLRVPDAAELPRQVAAEAEVPGARHAEALPFRRVAEAAAVPADAQVRPPGVAAVAALQGAAEQPAAVVVPDAAALRPAVVAAALDAAALQQVAVELVGAEAGQPGGPEACRGPVAGRPSGAAWVCRRDRPRPAVVRPGPQRRARPAQTKRCLQSTSP
jgi:hypothetical protein